MLRTTASPVCAAAALTVATLAAPPAMAIYIRADRPVSQYNDLANLFPATGYMLEDGSQGCTGTLIAPNMVLTAAHCIDFDADGSADIAPGSLSFGLGNSINAGSATQVSSIAINPNWATSGGEATFDMAILTLSGNINSVTPARITSQDPTGLLGGAVGYGAQGTGNSDSLPGANDKLAAYNIIDGLDSFDDTLSFDFDSPAGNTNTSASDGGLTSSATPLDLEGATAPGDSGSPLMAQFGSSWWLTGVLNGGFNPVGSESQYGDRSFYAAVMNAQNLAFLQGQGVTVHADTNQNVLGDYNGDGQVTAADYTVWADTFGSTSDLRADGNGDGSITAADYTVWADSFGGGAAAVPEPGSLALLGLGGLALRRRRR